VAVEKVPPQIPVRFVDVTREAGMGMRPLSSDHADPYALGPGACFFDFDNDGKLDIFLSDNGAQAGMSLYDNLGAGRFEDVTKPSGLDPTGHGFACTAGDYD